MPKFLRLQEGWITVGLLALLLFSVTLSMQQAQWTGGLWILTPVTLIGLASGIILAKIRRVPRVLLDLLGLEIGVLTVLLATASVMNDERLVTIQDKTQELLARTASWIALALRQQPSDDLLVFILSLSLVCWVLSYSSAYFVFRSRQLWWALVPCGVALLVNISYSREDLRGYLIVFMFSALLLMVRFNLLVQEERWQRERVNYSPTLTWGFLWTGSIVSVVLAVAMWFVPAASPNQNLNEWWNQVNRPWRDFEETMSSMFPDLPGNKSIGGYSSFGDRFKMGGALTLSNEIALTVQSKDRLYWRATTYDEYDGKGWKNTAPDTKTVLPNSSSKLALEAKQPLISEDKARKPVIYTVTINHPKDDILFAVSRPLSLSVPSRLNVAWRGLTTSFDVETVSPNDLPPDMRPLLDAIKQAQLELLQSGGGSNEDYVARLYKTSVGKRLQDQVENLKARGLDLTFDDSGPPQHKINIRPEGEIPIYGDLTSVHYANGSVSANMQYTATSLVSEASPEQLIAAGTDYEQWVRDRYLNLPADLPPRIRNEAETVTTGANDPYDKAKAIEAYLRSNKFTYSTQITAPPPKVDNVDWFLFESKTGYCEYYASAMIVMLRSLGVPTRMAAGYAPGNYDAKSGAYQVLESSAHTWVEVYFPTYGWVEFEPTPAQAATEQGEIPQSPESEASTTPSPEATRDPESDKDAIARVTPNPVGQTEGTTGAPMSGGFGWLLLGALVVAVLLAAFTWWIPVLPWARKEKRIGSAGEYYGKMVRMSRWLGLGPATHQTPFEFGDSVSREVQGTSSFTRSIARAYVRERFSKGELDVSERVAVLRAWDALRGRFLRALPVRQLKKGKPKGK